MATLKILHIDTERTWRGGEQQVAYLINGLKQCGHQNLLVAPPGSVIMERISNEETQKHPLPLRGEFDLFSVSRLAQLIRKENPSLIHAHSAKAHTVAVLARWLSRTRTPVVVSRRVCFPIKTHLLNRWKYQAADFYIPISRAIESVLHNFGIPSDRTEVVYSCIDLNRFHNRQGNTIRQEFSIPPNSLVIGNVGVCEALKDQATFIRAAAHIASKYQDIHFFVVGDGPLRSELQALVNTLRLAAQIHFPGFRKDIPDFLDLFSIFVMVPKLEGLGSAILEAEANALPIAATPVGGIPEIVHDGKNGFLIPVGDAEALADVLIRLVESPSMRKEMGKESYRLLIESFTVDKMVQKTIAVYQRLCK